MNILYLKYITTRNYQKNIKKNIAPAITKKKGYYCNYQKKILLS